MLVDVALHEDGGDFGVESDGEQHRGKLDRLLSDDVRLVEDGQCVQVDDAVENVVGMLS